jgi:hypothetical protein
VVFSQADSAPASMCCTCSVLLLAGSREVDLLVLTIKWKPKAHRTTRTCQHESVLWWCYVAAHALRLQDGLHCQHQMLNGTQQQMTSRLRHMPEQLWLTVVICV